MPPPKGLIEARKSEFLLASSDLFLQFGYDNVSVDMIIAQVGGSKGFIYNNFGGKAELFVECIRMKCAEIGAPLAKLDTSKMSCEQGLKAIGKRFLTLSLSDDSVALHRLVIAERLGFPEIGHIFMEVGPNRSYQKVAEFIADRQEKGELSSSLSAMDLAKIFLGMLNHDFLLDRLSASDPMPTAKAQAGRVNGAVKLFLHSARG